MFNTLRNLILVGFVGFAFYALWTIADASSQSSERGLKPTAPMVQAFRAMQYECDTAASEAAASDSNSEV